MNKISIRHLRYFEALAQQRHFGRAAAVSAVSQPALSLQMKELEEILGAQLIERSTRTIRLTPLGEAFAERTRDILRSVDELENLARASTGILSGPLRIGVIPTVAPYFLPKIIQALSTHYPQLDPRPREAVTQKLVADLNAGRLDVAIMALPVSEPSLAEHPLFAEEFVLVRPAADKGKPVPNPEALGIMRLLLLEEGHCFRDQALSFCKLSAAAPRDLMEGSSLSTLVQMVQAGIGVTLIPQMALAIETGRAEVSVARLPTPRPSRTIGLVWRKTNPLGQQFTGLISLLQAVGGTADADIEPTSATSTRAKRQS